MTVSRRRVFGGAVVAVAAATVVGGFLLAGPPSEARAYRLDNRRESDLRTVASMVDLHWNREKALPASVEAAPKTRGSMEAPRDPVTNAPYDFRVIDDKHYELCATFERPSQRAPVDGDPFWAHTSGRQCFRLEAKEIKR